MFDGGPEGPHGALGGHWQSYKALQAHDLPLVSPLNMDTVKMVPVNAPKVGSGSSKAAGSMSRAEQAGFNEQDLQTFRQRVSGRVRNENLKRTISLIGHLQAAEKSLQS